MIVDKVCVDATLSSNPSFSRDVMAELEGVVLRWAPSPPAGLPTGAVPARPGLEFYVHQVTSDSFSTTQPSPEVTVPATPALPAPPGALDPNLATAEVTWASEEARWRKAVGVAHAAALAGVAMLRNFKLDDKVGNFSAISGCLAALADEGPQDPEVRMVLASDLEENEPAVKANYGGARIIIDQNCPMSIPAAACQQLARSWTARLERQGAGSVVVVPANTAAGPLTSFLGGE
ncbi:MAG: hypothetical protein M0T80_06370 [Actinomycetota bacterium]|nr:hypothetical protein [Actinomycetota bacterium]